MNAFFITAFFHTENPKNWNAFPHPASKQTIGDKFIDENQHRVLQIPSVVTRGDYNLLINPNHSDSAKVKIISAEKFPFSNASLGRIPGKKVFWQTGQKVLRDLSDS